MDGENPRKTTRHPKDHLSVSRIETLSDGVFAIVMTLLVLDLHPITLSNNQFVPFLVKLLPNIAGYFVSFALLGQYWMGHLSQLRFLEKSDHSSHWINIFFFAFVAFVPFTTGMVSKNTGNRLALIIYGINLIIIGLALFWHWWYSTHNHRLVSKEISRETIRYGTFRSLFAPVAYSIAICFVYVSEITTLVLFAVIPLLYIIPGVQDQWMKLVSKGLPMDQ